MKYLINPACVSYAGDKHESKKCSRMDQNPITSNIR